MHLLFHLLLQTSDCPDIPDRIDTIDQDLPGRLDAEIAEKCRHHPNDAGEIVLPFTPGYREDESFLSRPPAMQCPLSVVGLCAIDDQFEHAGHSIGIDR